MIPKPASSISSTIAPGIHAEKEIPVGSQWCGAVIRSSNWMLEQDRALLLIICSSKAWEVLALEPDETARRKLVLKNCSSKFFLWRI
jgi:hypothetical protein